MARSILHGHFYVFMAGQSYNGALEQYLQAVVWRIAPQNIWTLRAVDFALYVSTAVVVYRIARQYFDDTWRRMVGLGLFCAGPYFNVWKGIHSHGSYAAGQLVAALALLAAARATRHSPKSRSRDIFFLGLTLGLSYWLSWTAFLLVLPALVWVLPLMVSRARLLPYAMVGSVFGSAPALGYVIAHSALPGLGGAQTARTVGQRLYNFSDPISREFLGLGYRYGRPGLPVVVQLMVLGVVGGALVVCATRCIARSATLGSQSRPPQAVLLYVPIVAAIFYAGSRYAWWTGDPRYLFAAYPALALGVASILGRRRSIALVGGLLAVVLSLTSTVTTIMAHRNDGPRDETTCLTRVAEALEARGITRVYSDYWTGMPLQMVAGDRLMVGPVGGGRMKFRAERDAVDVSAPVYYLAGHILDPMDEEVDDVGKVEAALASHHVVAQETPIAGCAVLFSNFAPNVRPWQVGLGVPMG